MSLVQHVSAIEGVDHDPEAEIDEDFRPIARKISYDVLQTPSHPVPDEEQPPATPAYNVSAVKRLSKCGHRPCIPTLLNDLVKCRSSSPFWHVGPHQVSCLDTQL
jgi:hypothetical protein